MATDKQRPAFATAVLKTMLLVSILQFVLGLVWMFVTPEADGVYVYATVSLTGLFAAVCYLLMFRWKKLGYYGIMFDYIALMLAVALWFHETVETLWGNDMLQGVLYGVEALVLIIIYVMLVIKVGKNKRGLLTQMSGGVDTAHFRHVYQLSAVLALIVLGLMAFLPTTKAVVPEPQPEPLIIEPEEPVEQPRPLSYELLDWVDVTLDEVIAIEPMIDSIPQNLQSEYNHRVFALKHLLLSGLMAQEHNVNDIIYIRKVHLGEFSDSQQQILDWFDALPPESQRKWTICPPVDNLQDFKVKLTEILEHSNNKIKI